MSARHGNFILGSTLCLHAHHHRPTAGGRNEILFISKNFVAPTGLEPVTLGLKDRCARFRYPFAPRGRSIFLGSLTLQLEASP